MFFHSGRVSIRFGEFKSQVNFFLVLFYSVTATFFGCNLESPFVITSLGVSTSNFCSDFQFEESALKIIHFILIPLSGCRIETLPTKVSFFFFFLIFSFPKYLILVGSFPLETSQEYLVRRKIKFSPYVVSRSIVFFFCATKTLTVSIFNFRHASFLRKKIEHIFISKKFNKKRKMTVSWESSFG